MHRLLMTSAAYRQSSARTAALEKIDPENRLVGRMPVKRIEAEVLYDTLLQVSDRLDVRPFDPPDPVEARPDGLVTPKGTERGWRRSIYVLQRRKELPTLLESFDFPQMTPNCVQRVTTTVPSQALNLMNDAFVQKLAGAFAQRVAKEAGSDPADRIDRAYWIALSRPPAAEEPPWACALNELTQSWATRSPPGEENPPERALSTYCHLLLNSAAFLTVD